MLRFWESDDPAVFLVAGQRRIGRAQLRQELDRARIYGDAHTDGWTYVVDTTEARFLSPLSLIDLMTIHRMPNVDAYVVVAPSRIVRLLARLVSPLVRSRVVRTLDEAERRASRGA